MLAQQQHVVGVLGGGFVAEVAEDLNLGRDTRDLVTGDLAANKAVGRIAKRPATRLRLNATTLRVEGHRVEVKLRAACVTHDESHRKVVLCDREPECPERRLDRIGIAKGYDEIEVLMGTSLPTDQRVDAPAPVDRGGDAVRAQSIENPKDTFCGHPTLAVRPNDIEFSGERKRVRCNEGLVRTTSTRYRCTLERPAQLTRPK